MRHMKTSFQRMNLTHTTSLPISRKAFVKMTSGVTKRCILMDFRDLPRQSLIFFHLQFQRRGRYILHWRFRKIVRKGRKTGYLTRYRTQKNACARFAVKTLSGMMKYFFHAKVRMCLLFLTGNYFRTEIQLLRGTRRK